MTVPDFTCRGVIVKGRPRIADKAANAALSRWAQALGDGTEVTLEFSQKKAKRSVRQNATLWGPVYDQIYEQILTHIMLDGGFRRDEAIKALPVSAFKQRVHYGLLAECFGYVTDPVTKRDVPAKTSSEMTTAEMAEYFQWLVEYAADPEGPLKGMQIILPDEFAELVAKKGAA